MRTDSVLAHWNLDWDDLARACREIVGERPVVLGGSLADDVGTTSSDIDVFAFGVDESIVAGDYGTASVRIAFYDFGPAALNLHAVRPGAVDGWGEQLTRLVTAPASEERPPVLARDLLLSLHALFRGRTVVGHLDLERYRVASGSDLLPLYVMLHSLSAFQALAEDVLAMLGTGDLHPCLSTARHCAEYAIDACLATRGHWNPNPKWRTALAIRAGLLNGEPHPELIRALFPDPWQARESVAACLRYAQRCLEEVGRDPVILRHPIVGEVEAAAAAVLTACHQPVAVTGSAKGGDAP